MPQLTPTDERKLSKLNDAIEWSRWRLQPFRERRLDMLRQYVGFQYSDDGSRDRVPVNFMELAVNTYTRLLASGTPRVIVTTPHRQLKAGAFELGIAVNHLLDEIRFGSTVDRWVRDALFSIGLLKVGMTPGVQGEIEGFLHDAGQPFCDVIDLDDWVHDMHAKTYEQIQFSGHRYFLPVEFVKESRLFQNTDDIVAQERRVYNERGDMRVSTISRGDETYTSEEYEDTVELWDIWIPRDNVVVTLLSDEEGGPSAANKPLRIVEWDGPENGPFHILAYSEVPNQVMPLSPMSLLLDLHDLANRLFNKLGRQAERQKTVTVVQSGAEQDGETLMNASDGQMMLSDRPEATREARYGGIDQVNLAFFIQLRDYFSYFGGNLDALGGLGPQAETLGQDQLLTAAATQRISSMQDRTQSCIQRVQRDLAAYLWYDPLIDLPLVKTFPGSSIEIPFRFNQEMKEGDFIDYNIKIQPSSNVNQTPQQRLQTIMQVLERIALPMMPFMQQQGIGVNMHQLLDTIATYSNVPELRDIIQFVSGLEQMGPTNSPAETPKAPVSYRNYTRRTIPGASRSGKDQIISQTLLNGNPQPAERNAITRPVG